MGEHKVPGVHMCTCVCAKHTHSHEHTVHTLATQTQPCYNSSSLSTRGLCVLGWEMSCQHAPHGNLEGREKLNSLKKRSAWWKMHGGERGTMALNTLIYEKPLAYPVLLFILLPVLSLLPRLTTNLLTHTHTHKTESKPLHTWRYHVATMSPWKRPNMLHREPTNING